MCQGMLCIPSGDPNIVEVGDDTNFVAIDSDLEGDFVVDEDDNSNDDDFYVDGERDDDGSGIAFASEDAHQFSKWSQHFGGPGVVANGAINKDTLSQMS